MLDSTSQACHKHVTSRRKSHMNVNSHKDNILCDVLATWLTKLSKHFVLTWKMCLKFTDISPVTATNTGNTAGPAELLATSVFSLKYLFEDIEVSQGSLGRMWATLIIMTLCGWGAVRAQLGSVSLQQPLAQASSFVRVNGRHSGHIFLVSPWATYQSFCKAESQNNYTAVQRDTGKEALGGVF